MQCPKCGYISFDYVKSCKKCGKDFEELAALLGPFLMDNPQLNWFKSVRADEDKMEAPVQEMNSYADLADIDVSDLVTDEAGSSQEEGIEEITILENDLIEPAAVDEDFQKALDDVIMEQG